MLEGVGHDSNEHVHANDDQQETADDEEAPCQVAAIWSITHSFCVEFPEHHDPNLQERVECFVIGIVLDNVIIAIYI